MRIRDKRRDDLFSRDLSPGPVVLNTFMKSDIFCIFKKGASSIFKNPTPTHDALFFYEFLSIEKYGSWPEALSPMSII